MIQDLPTVSVIIPVRNEAKYITECLTRVLNQDYPPDKLEVYVVDGLSADGTREIIAHLSAQDARLKMLDNPQRIVPTAMNIGIRASTGAIVIRVDARCYIEPDYVRQCVHYLQKTGAQNVGGLMRAAGEDYISRVIAIATSSPFGIGGSKFHYDEKEQFVDTVYLGAYPRAVLEQVGLYDETLVRNQDYELNYRVRQAGGKIFCTPAIKSRYYGRPSLRKLWRQYFQYGFWKVRVINKHPRSTRPRHLVAPLFVASLIILGIMSIFWRPGARLLGAEIAAYALTALFFSARGSARHGWQYLPPLPIVFIILHISWGSGFLWSVLQLILRH